MSSLADANRKYFDTISDAYDTKPWFTNLNNRVINELTARLDWLGVPFVDMKPDGQRDEEREVKVLDYACGPGIMSRVFTPHVTLSLGIDVSPNMVSTYNARAQSSNLYPTHMRAIEGDLFNKADPNPAHLSGPEYHNFDLVAVGFAFHHFEDVVYAARCLKERLRPGGVLVFNDFLSGGDALADEEGRMIEGSEGDHAFHDHGHGHGHNHGHDHSHDLHHDHDHKHQHDDGDDSRQKLGSKEMKASIAVPAFSVEGVKKFLTEAGFVDIDVDVVKEKVFLDFNKKMYRTVFFAKGRRPLEEDEKEREKSEL